MVFNKEKSIIYINKTKEIFEKEGTVSQTILAKYGINHVDRVFSGGWTELYQEAGIEVHVRNKRQEKDFIIKTLQELATKHGDKFSLKIACKEGNISRKSLLGHFETFENACKEAGIKEYTRRIKSRDEVISALRHIKNKYGEVRMRYINKLNGINQRDIKRHFPGGLEEATQAADIEYINLIKGQTKEEVIQAVQMVFKESGKVTEQTLKSKTNQTAMEKYFNNSNFAVVKLSNNY